MNDVGGGGGWKWIASELTGRAFVEIFGKADKSDWQFSKVTV